VKIVDCGISGTAHSNSQEWETLGLEKTWLEAIDVLAPGSQPRAIQVAAFSENGILDSRRNLIVSAPTNGGKSLVGDLFLLDSIRRGGRAVLLEPLRSLAQEKMEYFKASQKRLGEIVGVPIDLRISTGDYRLNGELMTEGPPEGGQLIIATPERLDAISRNPDHQDWMNSIGAVCVDEAHLVSNRRRGPCIERLLTNFTLTDTPPRICLLSASIGDTKSAEAWLRPCDVAIAEVRQPPLHKQVALYEQGEDTNQIVISLTNEYLEAPSSSVVIFVYQTASANKLARVLSDLGVPTIAYHSKMSAQQKTANRESFVSGASRCVVTTTALAMGVNLPATHVIIRDSAFADVGQLPIQDILQMMGRAGRGNTSGQATVLKRCDTKGKYKRFIDEVISEPRPELVSSFALRHNDDVADASLQIAVRLVSEADGMSRESLCKFFKNSLGGKAIVSSIETSLSWLTDPSRMLVYEKDHRYWLTAMGRAAIKSTMPMQMAASIGQLIRDLVEIDSNDKTLSSLVPLDVLTLIELVNERSLNLRRFHASSFEETIKQLDQWVEQSQHGKPVIYRNWIRGKEGFSKADELLGSLGIEADAVGCPRRFGYRSLFKAIVLLERANGVSANDLELRWGVTNLGGIEERWRDNMLWLLIALTEILDVTCFYYCLKESCEASENRIMNVDRAFKRLRGICYQLQEQIRFCSPLGSLLRSIKRTSKDGKAGMGIASIRKLEAAGITSLAQLSSSPPEQLKAIGISARAVSSIQSYLRRRRV